MNDEGGHAVPPGALARAKRCGALEANTLWDVREALIAALCSPNSTAQSIRPGSFYARRLDRGCQPDRPAETTQHGRKESSDQGGQGRVQLPDKPATAVQ